MKKKELVDGASVICYEISGEKDDNGNEKRFPLYKWSTKGLCCMDMLHSIGEAFHRQAEEFNLAHSIKYKYSVEVS